MLEALSRERFFTPYKLLERARVHIVQSTPQVLSVWTPLLTLDEVHLPVMYKKKHQAYTLFSNIDSRATDQDPPMLSLKTVVGFLSVPICTVWKRYWVLFLKVGRASVSSVLTQG